MSTKSKPKSKPTPEPKKAKKAKKAKPIKLLNRPPKGEAEDGVYHAIALSGAETNTEKIEACRDLLLIVARALGEVAKGSDDEDLQDLIVDPLLCLVADVPDNPAWVPGTLTLDEYLLIVAGEAVDDEDDDDDDDDEDD